MKTKQFIITIVVAAVLLTVGIFMNRSRRQSLQSMAAGDKLAPELEIPKVVKLRIEGEDGPLTVEFKDGIWRVAERAGYPAKYKSFITLLEDLRDLSVVQTVAAGEKQFAQLKLNAPGEDDAGTLVKVTDEDGAETVSLIFGKNHKNGGRFVRATDSKTVVVVSKSFYQLGQKAGSWLDEEFFKTADIREGTLSEGGKELWKVSREEKTADMKLVGEIPEGKEVDTYKIGRVKNAFSSARFADVMPADTPPEETGLDKAKIFVASQFDGLVYTVKVGKKNKDGKFHVAVSAKYEGPTERTPAKDEKPEDKETKDKEFADKLEELRQTAEDVNARTKDWVYLLDNWYVEGVTKPRDDMLKDKPKPPEEDKEKKDDGNKGKAADGK